MASSKLIFPRKIQLTPAILTYSASNLLFRWLYWSYGCELYIFKSLRRSPLQKCIDGKPLMKRCKCIFHIFILWVKVILLNLIGSQNTHVHNFLSKARSNIKAIINSLHLTSFCSNCIFSQNYQSSLYRFWMLNLVYLKKTFSTISLTPCSFTYYWIIRGIFSIYR